MYDYIFYLFFPPRLAVWFSTVALVLVLLGRGSDGVRGDGWLVAAPERFPALHLSADKAF